MPPAVHSRLPPWAVGAGLVAVAMAVMNAGTYGFTMLAARLLGPREYGALAALMALLLVLSVVSLGLQATGARRVSAAPGDRGPTSRQVLAATYRCAGGLGLLCLAAAPLVARLLRLDSVVVGALLAAAAVPVTVMGGQAGLLQGGRRWGALAGIYLALGLGRIGLGGAAVTLVPSSVSAMVGVAAGALVPVAVGWWALRVPAAPVTGAERPGGAAMTYPAALPRSPRSARGRREEGVLRELAHNGSALLAFFALSNADVVIARLVLGEHSSGLYAGGLILAKAVLFLPQFVVVLVFPSMSAAGGRRPLHRSGLLLLLSIGAVATVASWALPGLALQFVGGDAYADLRPVLWAFAGVGTLLSLVQLMVYAVVARRTRRAVLAVWAGLLVLVSAAPLLTSVGALLTAVAGVDAVVLGVLVLVGRRRGPTATPARAPNAPAAS